MVAEITEESRIADGRRVANFLEDAAVKRAFDNLRKKYYEAFKASTTRDELNAAWSKARVLDDLLTELRAVQDSGKRADANKQSRERGSTRR